MTFVFCGLPETIRAQDRESAERQFRTWIAEEIWPAARSAGIARQSFDAALGNVRPNWDLPDLTPPGAKVQTPQRQSQAEFRAPARYFAEGAINAAISGGRQKLRQHKATLERLERETGVPGHIVIAIWGRESGYGRAAIPHDAFAVLATLAFMSQRKELFRKELLAALAMVDRHSIPPSRMKSSRAGALGQPQFLPSSYLKHATDGDGDGRADIWSSEPDTLASIAVYLSRHGWVRGRDWGFEVEVPASVSCALEGPDRGRAISQWRKMGIRRVAKREFPGSELSKEGFLMMPAGRFGPAFIVTPNFYVLKEYNESDVYALFVGHAGDRIAFGSPPFFGQWSPIAAILRSDIAAMQRRMERKGYDVGGADGFPGFKTRRSVGEWQTAQGLEPTCFPVPAVISAIR